MQKEPVVYLNGCLAPASQATLSIFDFGIVIGATITDLLRTFHGRAYKIREHIDRFYRSCKYAHIDPPLSMEECERVTRELIEHNMSLLDPGGELCVVYFITPGVNTMYAGSAGGSAARTPTFCIHSFPMPFAMFRRFFDDGIKLVVPSTRHVPSQCVDAKIKHRSRLHWWLAEKEVQMGDSGAVPLLLDTGGNLTETSGANFLLVRNGIVRSPTTRNILRGISRDVVMQMCKQLAIPFEERDLQLHDAITADEAFLVTTPYCIAPVTSVNGVPVGPGPRGGPIFERLLARWSEDAGVDIRGQFIGTAVAGLRS